MGDVSTHLENAEIFLPTGDIPTDRAAADTAGGQDLVLPPTCGSNRRDGLGICGDICRPLLEHCCTVHRDQTHHGYVSGRRAVP